MLPFVELVILPTSLIGAFVCFAHAFSQPAHHNRALWWHHRYGNWRVEYQDGSVSQWLTRAVALEYADIYDGCVVKKGRE